MDLFRHFFGPRRLPSDREGPPEEPQDFDPSQLHRRLEEEMGRLLRTFGFPDIFQDGGRGEEPPGEPPRSLREQFLRRGYETRRDDSKVDRDLDERVGTGRLVDRLDEPTTVRTVFTGRSETFRTVTKPDGSMETERICKDSDGNEEITTCRSIGDKQYCFIKKRSRDGKEETSELFLDEDPSKFSFDKFFK